MTLRFIKKELGDLQTIQKQQEDLLTRVKQFLTVDEFFGVKKKEDELDDAEWLSGIYQAVSKDVGFNLQDFIETECEKTYRHPTTYELKSYSVIHG
jgi:hypothetical protein